MEDRNSKRSKLRSYVKIAEAGKGRKTELKGSLTLEAALLFPALTVLTVFLVYLGLYLYNACITEQCAYLAAFRGSCLQVSKNDSCARKAGEAWGELEGQRLLSFGSVGTVVKERLADVSVQAEGKLIFPFYALLPGSEESWEYSCEKKAVKLRPVVTIREIRRLRKMGKGNKGE